MRQDASGRKKQYIAVAIVVAAVVSGTAILLAATQQLEEDVVIDTNPLIQRSGSSTPSQPIPGSPQPRDQADQPAPEIIVSPSTSTAEGQVRVEGRGFEPNEGVAVAIKDTVLETTPPAVAADPAGQLSATASVPVLPPGQYEVVVSGEAGSSATEFITIA